VLGKFFPVLRVLKKAADLLIRSGEFGAADIFLRWLNRLKPGDLDTWSSLSALAYKQGARDKARGYLTDGIKNRPFETYPASGQPSARILRIRGVQNSIYMLGKSRNGEYKVKLRGGNFSDFYLTDREQYSATSYFILDRNILSPEDIPDFDIILNLISDPDLEVQSLETLSEFLKTCPDVPVVNPPDKVLETTRENNYRRLNGVSGLRFPKTNRFTVTDAQPEDGQKFFEAHQYSFPLLVRETGTQNGRSFRKVDTFESFMDYVSKCETEEVYVIQYEDRMFSDGVFRKMRVFVVEGKIYPVVCHFDTIWNVHGSNRREIMLNHPWMMEAEQDFMGDCQTYVGSQAYSQLGQLHGILGLDFFGVDFTVLEDGSVLIYEVNAAMRHSYDHADAFPYLLPYLKQVTDAFNDMILRKVNAAGR